jgi:hypothetical protein
MVNENEETVETTEVHVGYFINPLILTAEDVHDILTNYEYETHDE